MEIQLLLRLFLIFILFDVSSSVANDDIFTNLLNMKKNVKKMYGNSVEVIEAIDDEGKPKKNPCKVDEAKLIAEEKARRIREQNIDVESEDFLQRDPNLNYKYQKGPYLVYDCEDNHWVCTGRLEFMRCEYQRENTEKRHGEIYTCQHFRKFHSLAECINEQVHQTDYNLSSRFCLGKKRQAITLKY